MTWLSRLIAKFRDRHDAGLSDPSCKFGARYTTPVTYDYEAAKRSAKRAQSFTPSGRRLPKPRPAKPADVVAFRRKAAR